MTAPTDDGLAAPPARIERIAFLGTPDEAATVLDALHRSAIEVVQVISRPDRRRGRGSSTMPSPVKALALELGLPVGDELSAVTELDIDLAVVVAYGRIIPRSVLEQVPMVNLHFSLLPRWRGAAPVERAILAGDATTGVCVMEVAEGLDTGGVYARRSIDIGPDETAAELRSRLAGVGAELLVDTLAAGLGAAEPQVGDATYAAKIDRDETRLDFTRPAAEVQRRVRVGRAWTEFRSKRLGIEAVALVDDTDSAPANGDTRPGPEGPGTIVDGDGPLVAAGTGLVRLVEVKPEGKRAMAATDWANGVRPERGEQLG